MQPRALTCAQIRALEAHAIEALGISGLILMENAGRGLAELLLRLGVSGKVLICCGKGNNGGDGLVLARHLDNLGILTQTVLFARGAELPADALVNYQILSRAGYPIHEWTDPHRIPADLTTALAESEWIVDALFGTGLAGPLRAPFDAIIKQLNAAPARIVAADIPSGLDGDTGKPLGAGVRAAHTATFLMPKRGFDQPGAAEWTGEVHLVDIGVPHRFLEQALPG